MRKVNDIIRDLDTRDLLELAKQIARKHYVTLEELLGRSRHSPESRARHELWHRLYDDPIPSFLKLGEIFGRNHSTIMAGVHKHERVDDRNGASVAVAAVHVSCSSAERSECRESAPRPPIKKCDELLATPALTHRTGS